MPLSIDVDQEILLIYVKKYFKIIDSNKGFLRGYLYNYPCELQGNRDFSRDNREFSLWQQIFVPSNFAPPKK
jgi:hypothetical protein